MVQRDNSSLKSTQIQPCVNSSRNIFEFKNKLLEVEDEIKDRQHSKKSQLYYHQINELIEYLRDNNIIEEKKLELLTDKSPDHVHVPIERRSPSNLIERNNKRAFYAAKVALILNTLLLIAKIIACVFSRSISVISSTIDSAVDILSSVITFFTNYKIKKLNVYKHPQGKTRLIPLSVIIISAIMAITSLEVITASFRRIITGVDLIPDFSIVAIVIVVVTIVTKIVLFFYCSIIDSPTAMLLSQDSRNDVLTNTAVLIGLLLSNYLWNYGDSVCALIISSYVFFNWASTGISQLGSLVGKTASPQSLQKYGWICILHDPENVLYISTIRAYGFGTKYLLEVDIVLSENMPLRTAHDIGETLQQKLEKLPDIERAFVHLDFEKDHNPLLEHKLGILFE